MTVRVEKALAAARRVRDESAPRPFWRNREQRQLLLLSHAVSALALECEGLRQQVDVLVTKTDVLGERRHPPLDKEKGERLGSPGS